MSLWLWLGLGVVVVGGIFVYAYSKDPKNPLGYIGGLFQDLNLDTLLYNAKDIPEGTTIHPSTGESLLEWH